MQALIVEKKAVFDDFRIAWDESIEKEFSNRMAANPKANPEITLDNICQSYMVKALETPTETAFAWLKEKHGDCAKGITIKREIGTEIFNELLRSGCIERIKGTSSYAIVQ